MAYVDDIIVTGPNKMLIYSRKKLFMEKWECHDLGQCSEFLRSRICYENGKIYLDQCPYVDKILERFGLANARHAQTPLPTGYRPEPFDGTSTPQRRALYQSVIGSLLYLMIGSRPDIAFAVCQMAKSHLKNI